MSEGASERVPECVMVCHHAVVALWRICHHAVGCFVANLSPCCWLLCGGCVTMLLVALWRICHYAVGCFVADVPMLLVALWWICHHAVCCFVALF